MSKRSRKGEQVKKDKEEMDDIESPWEEEHVGFLPLDENHLKCTKCKSQSHAFIGNVTYCCRCFLGITQKRVCYVKCDICSKSIGNYLVDGKPSSQYMICGDCGKNLYHHAQKMKNPELEEVNDVVCEVKN